MPEYPTVNYPTILRGLVVGEKIRFESNDGSELALGVSEALQAVPGIVYNTGNKAFVLSNIGPFDYRGRTWGVTHLQKFSTWGWLKVVPDCYHRWWFWKLQQQDAGGNWLPGTERGLYFRKPFSWRWQPSAEQRWVWSKGYLNFGLHWD